MKKQPYRITIEQYEYKYSVEVDHSDISFTEYVELLRQLTLAAGWGTDAVEEFFDEETDVFTYTYKSKLICLHICITKLSQL